MDLSADLFPPDLPTGTQHLKAAVAKGMQARLLAAVRRVEQKAPFRQARTKSGGLYSAEMTNCGTVGWWSDAKGYRYTKAQPGSDVPWPRIPPTFSKVLDEIVVDTPWPDFSSDACLINHYTKGAKMGLHQDRDEADFDQPIVTVCLGAAADFLIGGCARSDKPLVLTVESGDVIVMGGESRMRFHGVRKIYPGTSPLPGLDGRISLTFRKALS